MQSFEELSKSSIVELDADLVDHSFVADRLDEDDEEFRELRGGHPDARAGQPILVRPHPDAPGRYQAVFGHRRLKAARELGPTGQGRGQGVAGPRSRHRSGPGECGARQSVVHRADAFCQAILAQGHSGETVRAALGIDETTFSKMRSVAGNIPADVIRAIGPAKATGRDRWWQLSKLMEQGGERSGGKRRCSDSRVSATATAIDGLRSCSMH